MVENVSSYSYDCDNSSDENCFGYIYLRPKRTQSATRDKMPYHTALNNDQTFIIDDLHYRKIMVYQKLYIFFSIIDTVIRIPIMFALLGWTYAYVFYCV